MIITITPNPSIDVSYYMDDFRLNEVNRCENTHKTAGGKGLNVTRVLHLIGGDATAMGFVGGNAGNFIVDRLDKSHIGHSFTYIEEETRSCIAIHHASHSTEILESGPSISMDDQRLFLEQLEDAMDQTETLSLSGSLPKGIELPFIDKILEITKDKKLIMDVSGSVLRYIVEESVIKPYAIKPNLDEISDLMGVSPDEIDFTALLNHESLQGIPLIMISLGKQGSVVKFEDRIYRCRVPSIEAINPVGSGDSTIAGLLYGIDHHFSIPDTLRLSMSLGVLNAMETKTGYVNTEQLESMKRQIIIDEVI